MRVVEVNSIDGLPGLRLVWKSLLKETQGASFHQSCEWFEAAFRHLHPTSRLRLLLVTGGGETVGILPLVQADRVTRRGTLRILGYPHDQWAPFHGPIGPQPTATLMGAIRYLRSQQNWDVLELRDLNRTTAMYQRTCTALQMAEMQFREIDEASCQAIELENQPLEITTPSLPDQYIRAGQLKFERHRPRGTMYDDADPRRDVFERCLELSRGNRQAGGASTEFLCDIHAAACRSGAADLNLLRHGNRIVACCYNVHLEGTLLMVFTGNAFTGNPVRGCHPRHRAERLVLRSLVSWMLQDSVARQDMCWLPGTEACFPEWPAILVPRASIVHRRVRGPRRFMGRLAEWLPLPT